MKIKELLPQYLQYLHALGRSPHTIKGARYDLNAFIRFLDSEQVYELDDLNRDIISEYQQDLAFRITHKGTLLSVRSQSQLLSAVRGFTRFLKENDYLLNDPGESIKLPRNPKKLPKSILTIEEVNKLLNAPDTRSNRGYRNRIMLEVLYDTGIRRSEILGIMLKDMDLDAGYIRVLGKGNKERVVPLSKRVCDMIRSYTLSVRPHFTQGDDPGFLFLNRWGGQMHPNAVWAIVKGSAKLARLKKNVSTHTLRHTCATHMLRNGAPIRHIQEMLGHESLESTQVYTRVTINDLKEIHARYHPSEAMDDKPKDKMR